MVRRTSSITQAEVARAIRAAKQAGAAEVELRIGAQAIILIRIASSTAPETPLAQLGEIVL